MHVVKAFSPRVNIIQGTTDPVHQSIATKASGSFVSRTRRWISQKTNGELFLERTEPKRKETGRDPMQQEGPEEGSPQGSLTKGQQDFTD